MKSSNLVNKTSYTPLDLQEIKERANALADIIENRYDELIDALLNYETYEVAADEIARTLDLLRSLDENEEYFRLRIGRVASFLPRNQPIYALSCFVIIPSLMASEVHFRIPHTMLHFFPQMLELLAIGQHFPNVIVSRKERLEFLKEQSASLEDPTTGETKPATDAVIFTGTQENAEKLRLVFDQRTLFISNGSGHNPLVVSSDANLYDTVDAIATLQFYNQGQDCAAPNAVLVHKDVAEQFLALLRDKVHQTKVGPYNDKSTIIGPISDPKDLPKVQELFVQNQERLDPSTPGDITARDATVKPTIIRKPLADGGNFQETYAPVIFVQEYHTDEQLAHYFEDQRYAPNAMYITLYGTSDYVENLIDKTFDGKILLDQTRLLRNTHLHAHGVERGTQPYGGYGIGASSLSIHGKLHALPTLPQRDIYEQLVKPLLEKQADDTSEGPQFTETVYKNVSKLLQIKLNEQVVQKAAHALARDIYVDTEHIEGQEQRYARISDESLYVLLRDPNLNHVATLKKKDLKHIQELIPLLNAKSDMSFDDFKLQLYEIPKRDGGDTEPKILLRDFFQNIYQLLFGRTEGPRLVEFLWGLEPNRVTRLLDVFNILD